MKKPNHAQIVTAFTESKKFYYIVGFNYNSKYDVIRSSLFNCLFWGAQMNVEILFLCFEAKLFVYWRLVNTDLRKQ